MRLDLRRGWDEIEMHGSWELSFHGLCLSQYEGEERQSRMNLGRCLDTQSSKAAAALGRETAEGEVGLRFVFCFKFKMGGIRN